MKLKVENFGPIQDANIEIKPMTIIIGKNNIGKSFLATLIYTLLTLKQTQRPHRYVYARDILRIAPFWRMPYLMSPEEMEKMCEQIRKEKLTEREIVNKITGTIIQRYSSIAAKILDSLLEQTFGTDVGRLVNLTSSNARIECMLSESLSLIANISNKGKIEVKLSLDWDYFEPLEKKVTPIIQKIKFRKELLYRLLFNYLML